MLKQELGNSSTVNHNRTMIQANQSVELDSNSLLSNYQSVNSSLSQKAAAAKSSIITNCLEKRDIEIEAAAHLLTKQEKSLCLQLDLKPTQYLTQKTLLLQVSFIFLFLTKLKILFFFWNKLMEIYLFN